MNADFKATVNSRGWKKDGVVLLVRFRTSIIAQNFFRSIVKFVANGIDKEKKQCTMRNGHCASSRTEFIVNCAWSILNSLGGSFVPVGGAVFKIVARWWYHLGWVRLPSTPDFSCMKLTARAANYFTARRVNITPNARTITPKKTTYTKTFPAPVYASPIAKRAIIVSGETPKR